MSCLLNAVSCQLLGGDDHRLFLFMMEWGMHLTLAPSHPRPPAREQRAMANQLGLTSNCLGLLGLRAGLTRGILGGAWGTRQ